MCEKYEKNVRVLDSNEFSPKPPPLLFCVRLIFEDVDFPMGFSFLDRLFGVPILCMLRLGAMEVSELPQMTPLAFM